jgi:hypothetical protein
MFNNKTASSHPTLIRKIRLAALRAIFTQGKKRIGLKSSQYVQNAKGNNIMRIDAWADGAIIVYGDNARNITHLFPFLNSP